MTALADLFAILIFALVVVLCYLVRSVRNKKRQVAQTIAHLARLEPFSVQQSVAQMQSITRLQIDNGLTRLPLLGPFFSRLLTNLQLLGWQQHLTLRLSILAMVGGTLGILLAKQMQLAALFAFMVALLVVFALAAVLYYRALHKYQQELKAVLPEAIDAITRACRAGVPITSAFANVAGHLAGPIGAEFKLIDHWLKLGVPLRRAMQDSAARIPMAESRFFAVILIINQEAGGALSETLERLTRTLRERQELQLKILSKTSEARASSKIVSALVPCIVGYMYFNSPEDFHFLMTDPVGKHVFIYAIASVAVGLIITALMVKRVR